MEVEHFFFFVKIYIFLIFLNYFYLFILKINFSEIDSEIERLL